MVVLSQHDTSAHILVDTSVWTQVMVVLPDKHDVNAHLLPMRLCWHNTSAQRTREALKATKSFELASALQLLP